MQEIVTDETQQPIMRPMLGAGLVSNSWNSAMLEEGVGMIAMGLLMGAFCGLILGLVTMQLARFVSYTIGRNIGGASWALISAALGALAVGVMMVTSDND